MGDATLNRGVLDCDEFCQWAGVSRATFYREAEAGRLRVRKLGRKTVVTTPDAMAWRDALPVAESGRAA